MSTPSKVFCSSCGVENLPGAKFCSACGAAMGAAVVTRAPASGPTVVREGLVGSALQRAAHVTMTLAALVTVLAVLAAFFGALEWGSKTSGFLETRALPGAGYIVLALLIVILNPMLFRVIVPRRRDVGMQAVRRYRRTLRERDGIHLLLAPGAIAWVNIGSLGDEGFDVQVGIYVCTVLPIVGLIATICLWPFRSERVYMDRQGVITRG